MKKSKKRIFEISISRHFFWFVVGLCFLTFLYFSYLFIQQKIVKNNEMMLQLFAETNLAAKTFDEPIRYTEALVKKISYQIALNPDSEEHISEILKSFGSIYSKDLDNILTISMFSWINKYRLLTINSKFGILEDPKDLSDREYIEYIERNPGILYLGKPTIGAVSRQFIIPAAMGVTNEHGRYKGSVVLGFNIYSMHQRLLQERNIESLAIQILYKNQPVIQDSFIPTKGDLVNIDENDDKIQVIKKPRMLGDSDVLLYKKIYNSSYGILIAFNTSSFYANKRLEVNYLMELLSVFATVLLIIFFLKNYFVNPIVILSKKVNLISSGAIKNIDFPSSHILEINNLSRSVLKIENLIKSENLLKSQLAKANNLKTVFLKTINHDLKNYLHSILNLSSMLLESKLNPDDKKIAKLLVRQSSELSNFVQDLLDIEQAETGKFALSAISKVKIKQLILRVVALNKTTANKNKISIKLDAEDDVFMTDEVRLKQILMNIISNSIKYSPQDTKIFISAKVTSQKKLLIEVKDEGFGMDKKDIKLLLSGMGKEIDKSDFSSIKNFTSYGIGMSSVLQLVELLRGEIKIESEKSKGTNIKISFDRFDENHPKYVEALNELEDEDFDEDDIFVENKDFKSANIMLAEDDPVCTKVTSSILKKIGYKNIKYAESGKDAVELAEEKVFDYIFMDANMPIMNGADAIKEIRKGKSKSAKIISISADEDKDLVERLKAAGADEIVIKPFTAEDLKKIL